jgi:hypothetical protein
VIDKIQKVADRICEVKSMFEEESKFVGCGRFLVDER